MGQGEGWRSGATLLRMAESASEEWTKVDYGKHAWQIVAVVVWRSSL